MADIEAFDASPAPSATMSPLLDQGDEDDDGSILMEPWLRTPRLRRHNSTGCAYWLSHITTQHWFVGLTFCVLLLAGVVETMTYSLNGQHYMQTYRCFLDILVVGLCGLFFGTIVFFQDQTRTTPNTMSTPWKLKHCWFFGIAACDCSSLYITILASHDISPPLRAILQQLTIPFSMIASSVFLNRTYMMSHVVSAVTIFLGVVLCICEIFGQTKGQISSPVWVLAFAVSCVTMALGGCLKEYVMLHPLYPQNMNVVNAWVASYQFLISLILTPVGILIQNSTLESDKHVAMRDIPHNFYGGFRCGILGLNTYDEHGLPLYGNSECSTSVITTWVYIASVFVFNILMLFVIRERTVVLFFIATSLTIPIVSIISHVNQVTLHIHIGQFSALQVIGIVVTVFGIIAFQFRTNSEFDMDDNSRYGDDDQSESATMLQGSNYYEAIEQSSEGDGP